MQTCYWIIVAIAKPVLEFRAWSTIQFQILNTKQQKIRGLGFSLPYMDFISVHRQDLSKAKQQLNFCDYSSLNQTCLPL